MNKEEFKKLHPKKKAYTQAIATKGLYTFGEGNYIECNGIVYKVISRHGRPSTFFKTDGLDFIDLEIHEHYKVKKVE